MRWSRSAPEPPDWLTARPYAHRGLHGGGIIENSRVAFKAAMAKGFGIELDVRAARCGTPFVFHDVNLRRLCGIDADLVEFDAAALGKVKFSSSDETIPALAEVLDLVACRVPILLEVKSGRRPEARFGDQLVGQLRHYHGPAAVMSFDPPLIRELAGSAPELIRGLVISEQDKGKFKGSIERRLAIRLVRPDFLAYDIRSLPSAFATHWRRSGRPLLSWTVRSDADANVACDHADQIIHEWDGAT